MVKEVRPIGTPGSARAPSQLEPTQVEVTTIQEARKRGLRPLQTSQFGSSAFTATKGEAFVVPFPEDWRNPFSGLSWDDRVGLLQGVKQECDSVMRGETGRREAYVTFAGLELLLSVIQEQKLRWGNPPLRATPWWELLNVPPTSPGVPFPRNHPRFNLHNRLRPELVHTAYPDVDLPRELKAIHDNSMRRVFRHPVLLPPLRMVLRGDQGITEARHQTTTRLPSFAPARRGVWLPPNGPLLTGRLVVQILRYYGLLCGSRRGQQRGWLVHPGRLDFMLNGPIIGHELAAIPWMAGRYFLTPRRA